MVFFSNFHILLFFHLMLSLNLLSVHATPLNIYEQILLLLFVPLITPFSHYPSPPVSDYASPHQYLIIPLPTSLSLRLSPPVSHYASPHQYLINPLPTSLSLSLSSPVSHYASPKTTRSYLETASSSQ